MVENNKYKSEILKRKLKKDASCDKVILSHFILKEQRKSEIKREKVVNLKGKCDKTFSWG